MKHTIKKSVILSAVLMSVSTTVFAGGHDPKKILELTRDPFDAWPSLH